MILWITLFILVLGISFVLALKSMKDYQEIPTQSDGNFGLFLIRNPQGLNEQFFNSLYHDLSQFDLNITFERLIKGKESAVVVFGSTKILLKHKDLLNLLELEDYTNVEIENISAWEMSVKKDRSLASEAGKIFTNLPELTDNEQFWWQVVLWTKKNDANSFQTQIRAIVYSKEKYRRKELTQKMQSLSPNLVKLPKGFSTGQILDFYKKRSFPKLSKNPVLSSQEVLQLISLS